MRSRRRVGRSGSGVAPRLLPRPLSEATAALPVVVALPKRWPKVVAVIAAVAAVIAASVFALLTFRHGSLDGSATPEEAIDAFVTSANRSDVIGVLESMLPPERNEWRSVIDEMFVDARRLQVLPNTAEARDLRDIAVVLEAPIGDAELVAPDVAAKSMRGSISSALRLSGREVIAPGTSAVDFRVAAVSYRGRWFVSLWHSLAESLRVRSTRGLTWPSARRPIVTGADSPEDAVRNLFSAVQSFSLRDLVAVLDPLDAGVLQRVAPWFMDGTQQAIDRLVTTEGLRIQISEPTFGTRYHKGRATVSVANLNVVVKSNLVNVAIRDNCGIFSATGQADTRQCLGDTKGTRNSVAAELTRLGLSPSLVRSVLVYDDIRRLIDGAADQGFEVRDVDGKWYVSPTPTVVRLLAGLLANGDAEGAATLVDDVETAARLLRGDTVFAPGTDTSGASGSATQPGQPGSVDEYGRYTECLALKTFDLAKLCIDQGIADGLFPRSTVDGSFLAPDCGWRGSRFDPSITRLSNAAYARLATTAAACMTAKIASGELQQSQMPFELVRVECLQGYNPARMDFERAKAYLNCQLGTP